MKIDYATLIINRINQSHRPKTFILIHDVIILIKLSDIYLI